MMKGGQREMKVEEEKAGEGKAVDWIQDAANPENRQEEDQGAQGNQLGSHVEDGLHQVAMEFLRSSQSLDIS